MKQVGEQLCGGQTQEWLLFSPRFQSVLGFGEGDLTKASANFLGDWPGTGSEKRSIDGCHHGFLSVLFRGLCSRHRLETGLDDPNKRTSI